MRYLQRRRRQTLDKYIGGGVLPCCVYWQKAEGKSRLLFCLSSHGALDNIQKYDTTIFE